MTSVFSKLLSISTPTTLLVNLKSVRWKLLLLPQACVPVWRSHSSQTKQSIKVNVEALLCPIKAINHSLSSNSSMMLLIPLRSIKLTSISLSFHFLTSINHLALEVRL